MTTVHAYTNDQRLADVPHRSLRRSRAATENIIPTTTGAAQGGGGGAPQLNGKLDGMAMRVPVPDGSTVDLVVELDRSVTVEEVNAASRRRPRVIWPGSSSTRRTRSSPPTSSATRTPRYSMPASTQVLGGNLVKVLAWYDNEWGYSNRVVDLLSVWPTCFQVVGRRL